MVLDANFDNSQLKLRTEWSITSEPHIHWKHYYTKFLVPERSIDRDSADFRDIVENYSKFRSNPSQNNLPKRLKADATMMKPIKSILISTGGLKNSAIVPVVLIWLCLLSFYGIRFIWKGSYSHLEIQEKLWMISY